MKTNTPARRFALFVATLVICSAPIAHAVTIQMTDMGSDKWGYDGVQRDAWLTSSTNGYVDTGVTGTPGAGDVTTRFGDPYPLNPLQNSWLGAGSLAGADGTNSFFTVDVSDGDSDTWGNGPLDGTWSISSAFWQTYGRAVITMHVGNGAGDPDWFFWEIKQGETSGNFFYERQSGGGGGLSNLFLWGGSSPPPPPPGPAAGPRARVGGLGRIARGLFRRPGK